MLLKDKFIFIVEDNTQNRVVFQVILIRQGARVEFERWGKDAVRRLKTLRNVDVVVLDLGLAQGVSGYDIFDDIRAIPEYSALPVVAVSATDPAVGIPKTKAKGFNGFIAKPIDDVRFPRQLAKIIAGEEVWDTGVAVLEDESE
ncbi:MAG TPA: response regulator [Oceanobacillus sp.]|nr:response regulator [Oceanobacillus sp.]